MGYLINNGLPYNTSITIGNMDRDYLYFDNRNSYGCKLEKGVFDIYHKAESEGLLDTLRETNDCIVADIK